MTFTIARAASIHPHRIFKLGKTNWERDNIRATAQKLIVGNQPHKADYMNVIFSPAGRTERNARDYQMPILHVDSFENACTLRVLAAEIRIMAVVSHFHARGSTKKPEMIRCQIKEMARPAGIS